MLRWTIGSTLAARIKLKLTDEIRPVFEIFIGITLKMSIRASSVLSTCSCNRSPDFAITMPRSDKDLSSSSFYQRFSETQGFFASTLLSLNLNYFKWPVGISFLCILFGHILLDIFDANF